MKNYNLNIKKSGRKGNLLASLLMVTASLLYSVTAMAADTCLSNESDNLYLVGAFSNWVAVDMYKIPRTSDTNIFENQSIYIPIYDDISGTDGNQVHIKLRQGSTDYVFDYWFTTENKGPISVCGSNDNGYIGCMTSASNWLKINVKAFCRYKINNVEYSVISNLSQTAVAALGTPTLALSSSTGLIGTSVTLTATATGGTESYTYKFYEDGVLLASQASNVYSYTPASPGQHKLKVVVDDNNCTCAAKSLTLSAESAESTFTATSAATLFLSHLPSVDNYEATLYGYLKYTGCQTISEYGFIYNTNESAISADTPTGTELKTTGSLPTQKTEFNVAGTFTNGTYYYRAFVKVSGTYFYSTKNDYGTFTINGACDVTTVKASIDAASAVLSAGSAGSTLTSETNANIYNWVCASQPDGAAAPVFATPTSKSTTFTVSAAGEYTFKLQAKCTGDANWTESEAVTFTACVAPTEQQLYLDERTANLLCQNETATATIVSQVGYDYTLYLGLKSYGTLAGNGATLTWRNVAGDGRFTVIATKGGTDLCATSMTPADQEEFDVDMTITVDPGSALAWQPVLLSATGDMNQHPTWEIVGGGTNAYLLDTKTRFEYADGQSRDQVIFKGDAINSAATTYTVAVTAEKTVTVPVTKTCASTVNVEITVSPATEQCN